MTEPEIVEEKESEPKQPVDEVVEPAVEAVKQDEPKEPELVEELTEEKQREKLHQTRKKRS